jgi:hypothetical protein
MHAVKLSPAAFYQKFGFILLPDSGTMFLPLADSTVSIIICPG